MGMFDTIEMDGKCFFCGAIIPDWQTKQLYCFMDVYKIDDRIPLHPNHKYLMIYSRCNGQKEYIRKESEKEEYTVNILWEGCEKSNDAICELDEFYILKGIEVLSPNDERMKYGRYI